MKYAEIKALECQMAENPSRFTEEEKGFFKDVLFPLKKIAEKFTREEIEDKRNKAFIEIGYSSFGVAYFEYAAKLSDEIRQK